jgi:Hypoxia induced protein conserved region
VCQRGQTVIQPFIDERTEPMAYTFFYLSGLAILVVFGVLVAGIWTLSREGTASLSQKLMRWRVGLQFVAVVVLMLAVFAKRSFSS